MIWNDQRTRMRSRASWEAARRRRRARERASRPDVQTPGPEATLGAPGRAGQEPAKE